MVDEIIATTEQIMITITHARRNVRISNVNFKKGNRDPEKVTVQLNKLSIHVTKIMHAPY